MQRKQTSGQSGCRLHTRSCRIRVVAQYLGWSELLIHWFAPSAGSWSRLFLLPSGDPLQGLGIIHCGSEKVVGQLLVHACILSLCLCLPLSLSPSVRIELTFSLSIYIYIILSLSLSLSLSISISFSLSLSLSPSLSFSLSLPLSLPLMILLSHPNVYRSTPVPPILPCPLSLPHFPISFPGIHLSTLKTSKFLPSFGFCTLDLLGRDVARNGSEEIDEYLSS